MNQDQLNGKLKKFKGDAKIWWGKTTGDDLLQLEGNKQKMAGYFQEQKGLLKEQAEKEIAKFEAAQEAFENKTEEVKEEIQAKLDKFKNEDLAELNGSFEDFANKIKEKYNTTQEEADAKVKEILAKFQ